jgi:UPF0176 protein
MNLPIVNIAAYKFVSLDNLPARRARLKEVCEDSHLKGTILLSPEGINLFIAGERNSVDKLLEELRSEDAFGDLEVKESFTDYQPFNRMLVRLKKEIIAFGVEGINPATKTSPKLPPKELKRMLDSGQPVTLLDTRNDYEVQLGTFAGAVDLNIGHFKEFPAAVRDLPEETKQQPIVMFCTGGIRCEKAGPLMEKDGFQNILQLEGGILKYLEECGGDHWNGECFVFDQRVAVDAQLRETDTKQCFACQASLTKADQQSDLYIPGEQCPHCHLEPAEIQAQQIAARQVQLEQFADNLPGCLPYDNERPLSVAAKYDNWKLIDFLCDYHPQVPRETWAEKCNLGRITYKREPEAADKIIRAGERYFHLLPATTEPPVNADIKILYEDDWLVAVNKPAPLPMHPCGRFNRNTLIYFLNEVYAPQKLRAAHRLDANTSGVVVFSRKRTIAAKIQPLFEKGEVKKTYIAKVQGSPSWDTHLSKTPISDAADKAGARLPDANGLPCSTEFTVLDRSADGTSLIECRPLTGRTNQIRIHLWDLGFPICGDPLYLPDKTIGTTQTLKVDDPPMCLHAKSIAFDHPGCGKPVTFEAELPTWAKASGDINA